MQTSLLISALGRQMQNILNVEWFANYGMHAGRIDGLQHAAARASEDDRPVEHRWVVFAQVVKDLHSAESGKNEIEHDHRVVLPVVDLLQGLFAVTHEIAVKTRA